ncbi:MAG: BolA family transcriptional regulator [Proteobacteria bacterium]|nr:BolA family transcriptional regulator [Pseudomonadota bacterium]
MTVQDIIEQKILTALTPSHLDVINESHMHNVPPGSESHFKLVIVSSAFENLPLVQRHQKVNAILAKELKDDIHALSMETRTAMEWKDSGGEIMASPLCHGGGKG